MKDTRKKINLNLPPKKEAPLVLDGATTDNERVLAAIRLVLAPLGHDPHGSMTPARVAYGDLRQGQTNLFVQERKRRRVDVALEVDEGLTEDAAQALDLGWSQSANHFCVRGEVVAVHGSNHPRIRAKSQVRPKHLSFGAKCG